MLIELKSNISMLNTGYDHGYASFIPCCSSPAGTRLLCLIEFTYSLDLAGSSELWPALHFLQLLISIHVMAEYNPCPRDVYWNTQYPSVLHLFHQAP